MIDQALSATHLSPYTPAFSRAHGVSLLRDDGNEVHVAIWKPPTRELRRVLAAVHGKQIVFHPTGDERLRRDAVAPPQWQGEAQTGGMELQTPLPVDRPGGRGVRRRNLSPEDTLLRRLLETAVDSGASDLSLWPSGDGYWTTTMRVAGRLSHLAELPPHIGVRLVRRVALRAQLDILDEESPGDGMMEVPWFPGVRFRAAVVGTGSARILAIRLLSRRVPPPPALGFSPREIALILREMQRPSGLILVAGPTGSGKTTTIAAFLSLLPDGGRKVVTLEDPVEYRIPGVVQIERGGSIRADLIAAAMRQDPDVLVLGETRAREHGAQLAQAVLTGHLVISSVHARGRAEARARMEQLGVPEETLRRETLLLCCQSLSERGRRLHIELAHRPWGVYPEEPE
jgi:type II secretory ATPase GspE/PulE/Tfp pilus assembly ATPase PilB-like protein